MCLWAESLCNVAVKLHKMFVVRISVPLSTRVVLGPCSGECVFYANPSNVYKPLQPIFIRFSLVWNGRWLLHWRAQLKPVWGVLKYTTSLLRLFTYTWPDSQREVEKMWRSTSESRASSQCVTSLKTVKLKARFILDSIWSMDLIYSMKQSVEFYQLIRDFKAYFKVGFRLFLGNGCCKP